MGLLLILRMIKWCFRAHTLLIWFRWCGIPGTYLWQMMCSSWSNWFVKWDTWGWQRYHSGEFLCVDRFIPCVDRFIPCVDRFISCVEWWGLCVKVFILCVRMTWIADERAEIRHLLSSNRCRIMGRWLSDSCVWNVGRRMPRYLLSVVSYMDFSDSK